MTKGLNTLLRLALLVMFLTGCVAEEGKKNSAPIPVTPPGIGEIRKIDDFPFYVMTYDGDYHFDDYLKRGVSSTSAREGTGNKSWACSCFAALGDPSAPFFGRNFDWRDCIPLLLITRPEDGYASVSMVDLEYLGFSRQHLPDDPATNQGLSSAPYLPFDGMNEKGVAVGMMAVPSARGPQDPARVTIRELELIRLVLDYAASVDEAIGLIRRYNIRFTDPPIHYMISDKSGASAIVEFVDGEMKVIANDQSWQVCTNFIVSGTGAPLGVDCWRYNKAYSFLRGKKGMINQGEAFNLAEDVSQANTIWSAVYDLHSGLVNVAISKNFSRWYQFRLLE